VSALARYSARDIHGDNSGDGAAFFKDGRLVAPDAILACRSKAPFDRSAAAAAAATRACKLIRFLPAAATDLDASKSPFPLLQYSLCDATFLRLQAPNSGRRWRLTGTMPSLRFIALTVRKVPCHGRRLVHCRLITTSRL